jgi:hypothetical protein
VSIQRALALLPVATLLLISPTVLAGQQIVEVPAVDAGLGTCSAAFTVVENGKPAYNARVTVTVRSGAFGIRKSELEVGTNNEGKCRVTGLPERAKKPFEFVIRLGDLLKRVSMTPEDKCDATFTINLTAK